MPKRKSHLHVPKVSRYTVNTMRAVAKNLEARAATQLANIDEWGFDPDYDDYTKQRIKGARTLANQYQRAARRWRERANAEELM